MPKKGEKNPHRNWKLIGVPCGPEQMETRQELAHGSKEHILALYEAYRQKSISSPLAIVVTDERGRAVYACSE